MRRVGPGGRGAAPAANGIPIRRIGSLLGRAATLVAKSAFPLLRTLVAACALLLILMVPLWIWLQAGVRLLGLDPADQLTTGDIVKIVVVAGLPAVVVMIIVGLATVAGATIVLDDVACGRRPRARRAVGRGLRSAPRLFLTIVPAVLGVTVLLAAAPVIMLAGLVLVLVTAVGRRIRPSARWPSRRTLVVLVVPFAPAAICAARWSLLPSVVLLEHARARGSFRRAAVLARERVTDLAIVLALVVAAVVAVSGIADAMLAGTAYDWIATGVKAAALLIVVAIAVQAFVDAGGVTAEPPPLTPPRVKVAAVVVVALVVGLAPAVLDAQPAGAAVGGATIVVDDLGDDVDATPGDGACATAGAVCTLRAAVTEANLSSDEIVGFAVSGTISVGSALAITQPVTIDGDAADVTVSGGGTSAVFFVQIEIAGGGYGAIRNLTIADGFAGPTGGAAVDNNAASAGFVLENVTVRNSTVGAGASLGGAVLNLSKLTIANSTFDGNSSGIGLGGTDVANRFAGDATIVHSTFTGSSGASSLESTGAAFDVRNSIVTAPGFACSGTITGAGNVTTDAAAICPGALATTAELGLKALADNGGPTDTVRLAPASVAIDAGSTADCSSVDQRGDSRPKGTTCDAGAYEFDPGTTTSLSSSPRPSTFGASVTLDAAVTADDEPETPTGSVEFFDGAASLGTVPLDGAGAASKATTSLTAGPHSLTATYLPDTHYATSTSTAVAHSVSASATTVVVSSTGSPTLAGDPVTFTIDVNGAGTAATGSVTLLDGTATLATPTLNGSGQGTFTTSSLGGGHHEITAAYAGDANHQGATSAVLGHDVVGPSATTLTGPAGPTVYGNPADFDVAVSPAGGGPTPTGSVSLLEGAVVRGSATLDGAGEVTITISSLVPGPHSLTASYAGDSFNNASTSTVVGHTVTRAATATALAVAPAGSSVHGNPVTITASVSSTDSVAVPAGSVEFFDGSTSIGSGSVDPTGVAALVTSSLPAGTHALRADFTPAIGFVASSSPVSSYAVSPATTATGLTASSAVSVFGQSVTLVATVTSADSPRTPVGAVTFRDGTTVLGVVALDGAGTASLATTDIAVGSRTLTAEYPDATSFAGSTSAGLAHTVNPAGVAVHVTDTPDPSVSGTSVTLDVTVSPVAPGAGVPTGTATVREGATVLATLALDSTGAGTTTLTGLTVGTHTLVVDYAGDGDFAAGSAPIAHTVVADTAAVDLASSAPAAQFTQPVTFTATVTGTGPGTPTGTVTFRNGATVLGSDSLDGAGQGLLTLSNLPFGTHTITAEYPGDAGFGPATDSITQKVNTTGTATTLTFAPPAPTVYDVVTLTATVVGTASAIVPTGTVTFHDNGVPLGTAATDGSGAAVYSTTFGRVVHTLTASFSGTPGWAGSSSAPVSLTPARAPTVIAVSGAPSPVSVGDTTTWTATLNLSPDGPAPTGSIQFWSGSTLLGNGSIVAGRAILSLPAPSTIGPWGVFATYNGDSDHEPASSSTASVSVIGAVTSITAVVPPTTYVADPVVLGAQVTSAHSGGPITGVVRFTSNSPEFAPRTATLDATGFAQVTTSGIPAGTWTLTAGFEPSSGSMFAASSTTVPFVMVRRPAVVSLTAPASATVGTVFPVNFAVTDLTGTGPTPVGTVVVNGGGVSCSGTVAAGTCTVALATPGRVTLTATYSGDAVYDPATSNPAGLTGLGNTSTLTAGTPTQTWVTGDPIVIAWSLVGPPSGEVVVTTPFGEVCRSTTLRFGACTITFPFEQRGQTIPVDVAYIGSSLWSAASATVSGNLVGCYPVPLSAVPEFAGDVTAAAGNCNRATGYRSGTTVNAAVEPVAPYRLDHWLEDGATSRVRSFVVSEDDHSATAIMNVPCVKVELASVEQVDLGPLRSNLGQITASPPNCPGRPTVDSLGSGGTATAWYLPGTDVTFTPTTNRPGTDELKGWFVDGVLRRTRGPLTLEVVEDIAIEGRFGVRCGRPAFTTVGEGAVDPFTTPNCLDPEGFAWQLGTELGVHVVPGPHHWIASYGNDAPQREITSPRQWPDAKVVGTQANGFWTVRTGLEVEVVFETCRLLALTPEGPGRIDPVTAPNCRTRLVSEGLYYEPGSRVELQAVPDPPSTRMTTQRRDGDWVSVPTPVEPVFLRWQRVEEEGKLDTATGGLDPDVGFVRMAEHRNVGAAFSDEGRCQPFITEVKPDGAATLDVTLVPSKGHCREGEADLADGGTATFRATPVSGQPRVGWTVTTTDEATDETVHLRLANDGAPVAVSYKTIATAYVCAVIQPEITLVAPDGTTKTGPAPPGSDFVVADRAPDCPLWENGYTVGSTVVVGAAAPPVGYEFDHWEGDITGDEPEVEVVLDGSAPTIVARAFYRVRCVTVTVDPRAKTPEVSPDPNCPERSTVVPLAANQFRFIGGTAVMLDARPWNDHDFASWTGDGLLDRDAMVQAFTQVGLWDLVALAQAMDHPAMITADFDMTVTANYEEHSTLEKIGDDLATFGKKVVGVLSEVLVGVYESVGLGLIRAALGFVRFLTKTIDPNATDTLMVFDRMQDFFDLTELTLLCAAEWAKGSPPKNPANTDAFDNNGIIPPIDSEDVVTTTANLAGSGVDLSEAIGNYRKASLSPEMAARYQQRIPGAAKTVSGTTATGAKLAWKSLGAAAAVGSAIYSFVADGPGIVWEDTAELAWETGDGPFMDCVQRHLHEALPEYIDAPGTP